MGVFGPKLAVTPPIAMYSTRNLPTAGHTNFACALTNKKIAWIVTVPAGKGIDTISYYPTSQAGTPGLRLSVQGVSARAPNGTIEGSGNCFVAWTGGSETLNDWNTKTLGTRYVNNNAYPVQVAIVFDYSGSGNDFTASHATTLGYLSPAATEGAHSGTPFCTTRTTSTWTWAAGIPALILKDSTTGEYIFGCATHKTSATQNFNSLLNAMYGIKWTVPCACRLWGIETVMRPASGSNFQFVVRRNGAHISAASFGEAEVAGSVAAATLFRLPLSTPLLCEKGDVVYILLTGTSSTDATFWGKMPFASNADLQGMFGPNVIGASAVLDSEAPDSTAPVSVSDESANMYPIVPVIDQIVVPVRGV